MEFISKIIPIVVINDLETAEPLGEALVEGGIPVAEVTLRTPYALEAIAAMKQVHGLSVGAGTVLTREQAISAHEAGIEFLVSPALHEEVIAYGKEAGVPVIPGIATPSEIAKAISLGLDTLKFFPAEAMGGANVLKAISAVYPDIKIMPTGGINPGNVQNYLDLPCVAACGGSWMVPPDLLAKRDYPALVELIKEASQFSN